MPNSIATQKRSSSSSQRKDRRPKAAQTEFTPAHDMLRQTQRIDRFLLMHSSRLDGWRELAGLAESWQAGATQRGDLETAVEAMEPVEGYHAYPGPRLFTALRDRIAANDASGSARLALRISNALLTRAYRERPAECDLHAEVGSDEIAEIMPPGLDGAEAHRPYFEVLFVSAQPASRWPALADELRRLRRREDASPTSRSSSAPSKTRLRRGRQSGDHLGGGAGGISVPLAFRGAGASGRAGYARRR